MLLSKRWRFLWTLMPKLYYRESRNAKKSLSYFVDKSLKLHKAPLLQNLRIHIDQQHPLFDVGKWILCAVERGIQELQLGFGIGANPTSLPIGLYTCKTLVELCLSSNKIMVDVPFPACLPSLRSLYLINVKYKDQDSHVRLLSSCRVLKALCVLRTHHHDNVREFNVKVPSLERLTYRKVGRSVSRSLVIDSPQLLFLKVSDSVGDYRSILRLMLTEIACCSAIKFPLLLDLMVFFNRSEYWLEPLMLMLQNSPKLKALRIKSDFSENHLLSWNQPSSVPGCLSSHLEIFEWELFGGSSEEKQCVAYILANSNSLKTVRFTPRHLCDIEERHKTREDLESMYRVSASSQLVISDKLLWS